MLRLGGFLSAVRRTVGDMAKGRFYYAVRRGLKPGVYKTWEECKAQVEKFPAAEFKKFAAEKDAWAFYRGDKPTAAPPKTTTTAQSSGASPSGASPSGASPSGASPSGASPSGPSPLAPPRRGPEPLQYIALGPKRRHLQETTGTEETPRKRPKTEEEPNQGGFTYMGDSVVIYTDGCCSGNGKSSARAGIGVYFGHNHRLNVSERLRGRQTNQRAEIQAACRALEVAKQNQINKVVLFTDSKFTINGVTSWVKSWKVNGWRLKSGGNVTNKEDFQKLDQLNSELQVTWMHIPGHSGYHGNEEADRLSREGAAKLDLD